MLFAGSIRLTAYHQYNCAAFAPAIFHLVVLALAVLHRIHADHRPVMPGVGGALPVSASQAVGGFASPVSVNL
jgi:hypothetical protein